MSGLKEVGFWRQNEHQKKSVSENTRLLDSKIAISRDSKEKVNDRDDPMACVDHAWCLTHSHFISMLEWYLSAGAFIESVEFGYSYCRFSKCSASSREPKIMGACTMTDGMYCWPEGYVHYITYHHVRPPQDFIDHVKLHYRRAVLAAKALTREFGEEVMWSWDCEQRCVVPMAFAMQEWVLKNTTLRLPCADKRPPIENTMTTTSRRICYCCECIIS